jgi:hypothetical protein
MEKEGEMIWASGLRVMQSKPSMQWRRSLVTFTAAISCAAIGFAQVADDTAERTSTTETDNQAVEPVTPPDTVTDNDSGSVVDYEPSESISEDLSVSFPVDI